MMTKSNPLIEHIDPIFDVVGRTIVNVGYAPPQYGEEAHMWLTLDDGTRLTIIAKVFTKATLEPTLS